MIKLVEVTAPPAKGETAQLVQEFVTAGMKQAKLDRSDDNRPIQSVYSGIYGYLKAHPDIPVKIQMVANELYLTRTDQ